MKNFEIPSIQELVIQKNAVDKEIAKLLAYQKYLSGLIFELQKIEKQKSTRTKKTQKPKPKKHKEKILQSDEIAKSRESINKLTSILEKAIEKK